MDKILVLGGTGAMGSFLVQMLQEKYDVYVTSRKKRNSTERLHFIIGNAHDTEFLKKLIEGNHYRAIIDFMNYSTYEYSLRVDMLLNATDQLFFISSSRVYADERTPLKETSPRLLDVPSDKDYLATDDYGLAKARQEDILRNKVKKNWTIIRPYMTYFPNRLDLGVYAKELWLYRVIKGRTVIFTEDIAGKLVTLTHGVDVATGIAALVGIDEALGETFHITQEKALLWKEVFAIYKDEIIKAGYNLKVKMFDHPTLDEGYIYQYDRLYNRVYDNTKIKTYIDTSSFVPPELGLRRCIREFLKNPCFDQIDWKKQAYWDTLTNEYAKKCEFSSTKNYGIYLLFRYIISYPFALKLYHLIKH